MESRNIEKSMHCGLSLHVEGSVPPPRSMPKKVSNSEKTITTRNLSQHRYLSFKKQVELETEATIRGATITNNPEAVKDEDTKNRQCMNISGIPITAAVHGHFKRPFTAQKLGINRSKAIARLMISDWERDWYSLYHHFTHYGPSNGGSGTSYCSCRNGHDRGAACINYSDLRKLLTSVKLTPPRLASDQANQQYSETCGHSETHGKVLDSDNEDLPYELPTDELVYEADPSTPPILPEPDTVATINIPFKTQFTQLVEPSVCQYGAGQQLLETSGTAKRVSSKMRRPTKSAPMYSSRYLSSQLTTPVTHVHSTDSPSPFDHPSMANKRFELHTTHGSHIGAVNMKSRKQPQPRSYWYEMKTPEFHVEARRNNTFLRKSCNW